MNIIRRIKTQGVFIPLFILFICIKRNMLFSIRRNYHRMWRRSVFCREKPSKSKGSADLGQKWMCVSVSAEWWGGN